MSLLSNVEALVKVGTCLPGCQSVHSSICQTICLSGCLPVYHFDRTWRLQSKSVPVCPPICRSVCVPVYLSVSVADLMGGCERRLPPPGFKFFQFHAVFGEIWQNRKLAQPPSPGGLAPPPRGNPGSATGLFVCASVYQYVSLTAALCTRLLTVIFDWLHKRALWPRPRFVIILVPSQEASAIISFHVTRRNRMVAKQSQTFHSNSVVMAKYCSFYISIIWKFFRETIFGKECFMHHCGRNKGLFFASIFSHNFLLIWPQLCDHQQLFTWFYFLLNILSFILYSNEMQT